ncbi:MAG: hypothetical protein GC178_06160 [Flavobacteriales bacterium]|nr:hypothetical protein [Flavobacteriales bacterium]
MSLSLNQKRNRVEISDLLIENQIVFNYFDKLPAGERDEKLLRAIYIGVLALMEDRLSAFLSKTQNELGTELESLKVMFDLKQELFYKTTMKGMLAEEEIAEFLNNYFQDKKLKDVAKLTGNAAGNLPKNKTGDIICEVDGSHDLRIAIECKFDKSVRLGDIESKDVFIRKTDTAWSQLLEAQANRDSKISMIVFDRSLVDNSVLKQVENVGFIPGVGFIVIIDSQRGDYTNLAVGYMLARDIAVNAKETELDKDMLALLVTRIVKDLGEVMRIKMLVEQNISNNQEILKQLERSMLLMEFNQQYLGKFLKDGKLTKEDMLDFYMGEDVKEKFKAIEKQITSV